jgi:hypothetical protein
MKHRIPLITVLALAVALFVTGTAQADTFGRHFVSGAPHPAHAAAPSSALGGARLVAPLNPFAVVGIGTAGLNGVVYDGTMAPVNGAIVDWWAPTGGVWNNGEVVTGADGAYSFANADAASGQGQLVAMSPGSTNMFGYARYDATWPAPGPTTFDFQAGVVPLTIYRGGPWSKWSYCSFVFDGSDAQSSVSSMQSLDPSDTTSSPVIYSGNFLAGTYTSGTVNFWPDEGWSSRHRP